MARIFKPDWRAEKESEAIAARRKADDAKRDPELEQCVIAYCNWRRDGNQGAFIDFSREWYAKRDGVST